MQSKRGTTRRNANARRNRPGICGNNESRGTPHPHTGLLRCRSVPPSDASETTSPSSPDDDRAVQELLRRWFDRRDQSALDQLLDRNLTYLQRYASGRIGGALRRKEDTGDVIHDAVIEFMRYSPPFVIGTEVQFRGLLRKIVDGVLAGHHRWFARLRRQVAKEKPLPSGTSVVMQPFVARDPSPSAAMRGDEREAAVRIAITTLDPTDQRIVLMRAYEDQSFASIGAAVDMKEDSVRVRFSRALGKISRKLLALQRGDVDQFLE